MKPEVDGELQEFIDNYGEQSYHIAVKRTVIGHILGDDAHAERHARLARELLQLGYHKFPEAVEPTVEDDLEWLVQNPTMTMGAKYHDAGHCWTLIDAFRAEVRRLRGME